MEKSALKERCGIRNILVFEAMGNMVEAIGESSLGFAESDSGLAHGEEYPNS